LKDTFPNSPNSQRIPQSVVFRCSRNNNVLKLFPGLQKINLYFQKIVYFQGASVIRMLEYYMGPERFQKGVSRFLTKFSYANAETQDLWLALQSEMEEGTNITLLMDTWTRQMGYPVLRAEITHDVVNITQHRYLANRNEKYLPTDSPFEYKWEVPLRILSGNDQKTFKNVLMHHMEENSEKIRNSNDKEILRKL